MIAASGAVHGGQVERLLAGVGGHHLEAGIAQDHPQRPQDLRLVVADEHPRCHQTVIAATSAVGDRARLAGSSTTKLVPWPGSDSTAIAPPLASMKPSAIARPSPEPGGSPFVPAPR